MFPLLIPIPLQELLAAQQFVEARLGARLRVDALDDDGAIEAVAAVGGRQVAADDDRARRNAPVAHRTRPAVVDLRALADVDAHRDHRILLDDHALDDLRARADEAVVLDDRRIRLHRLEHAADADAAREVDVLADLRARADGDAGVDHRARV